MTTIFLITFCTILSLLVLGLSLKVNKLQSQLNYHLISLSHIEFKPRQQINAEDFNKITKAHSLTKP